MMALVPFDPTKIPAVRGWLLLLFLLVEPSHSFTSLLLKTPSRLVTTATRRRHHFDHDGTLLMRKLFASTKDGDNDNDNDNSNNDGEGGGIFYNDFEGFVNDDDDDEDDDFDFITTETLGDWREFRRDLAAAAAAAGKSSSDSASSTTPRKKKATISTKNEELLRTQNEELADEYLHGVWAHPTSTPEVGGLVCRMPLEVELQRNTDHSVMGKKLRNGNPPGEKDNVTFLYRRAQMMIAEEMKKILEKVKGVTTIDPKMLDEESNEMLKLYVDHQEKWQEVCLVMNHDGMTGTSTTLVLNRPMAFQLTENIAQLVLHGSSRRPTSSTRRSSSSSLLLEQFMKAFGTECAIYVGGPDAQDQPAILLHPFAELPGAVEVSPGTKIYQGGVEAAIRGVLNGKYKPMDFRFFVGRHAYTSSSPAKVKSSSSAGGGNSAPPTRPSLDMEVRVGKYQPVASARTIALKQCISLPKPLWHEVLELCGGELEVISKLELEKRSDL